MNNESSNRGRAVIVVFNDGTSKTYTNKTEVSKSLSIPYPDIIDLLVTGDAYHQKKLRSRKKEGLTLDYVLTEEDVR